MRPCSVADHPVLGKSLFLKDAAKHGLIGGKRRMQSTSVFVPANDLYIAPKYFREFWNRHVVRGEVRVGDGAVQRVASHANMVYALYPDRSRARSNPGDAPVNDSGYSVAGVPIAAFWNEELNGVLFHGIAAACVPEIRPARGQISQPTVRASYFGGENIVLDLVEQGLPPRNDLLVSVAFTFHDRKKIGAVQNFPWLGNGTSCRIVVPDPPARLTDVLLWIMLVDRASESFDILSMTFAFSMEIFPNVNADVVPTITDINPRKANVNDQIWIRGTGFTRCTTILFGNKPAMISEWSAGFISCFAPHGSGMQSVFAVNGPIYFEYRHFVYLEH